jgi:hypothetical protein
MNRFLKNEPDELVKYKKQQVINGLLDEDKRYVNNNPKIWDYISYRTYIDFEIPRIIKILEMLIAQDIIHENDSLYSDSEDEGEEHSDNCNCCE